MASSDIEFETLPKFVSDYHFEDANRELISFSVLPLRNENEFPIRERTEIFLSGIVGDGLHRIYKLVKAWKYNISGIVPKISVLVKGDYWIQLLKARKGYVDEIMSILITVQCLHFVRKNPETSAKYIWAHLGKTFSSFGVLPYQNYLSVEASLINDAMRRDEILRKSKFLFTFLKEKPQKRKNIYEAAQTSKSVIAVNANVIDDSGHLSDEDGLGVCVICDNGGDLLCCDGPCLRTFHATKKDGADSECESLGLTAAEVNAMKSFVCKNCQYKQHQCFCCWKLGSSDKDIGAEVFKCNNAKCGLFYHPNCIAEVLHQEDEAAAKITQGQIVAGESFVCPIHRCGICKSPENPKVHELQFAICRRCPTSYHRKCLKIAFDGLDEENFKRRAWEDLLPNRILLYCLKHEIDAILCTPKRDFKFPVIQNSPNFPRSKSRKSSDRVGKPASVLSNAESTKRDEKRAMRHPLKKGNVVHRIIAKNMTSLGKRSSFFLHKGSKRAKCGTHPPRSTTANPVKAAFNGDFRLDEESRRRLLKLMKKASSSISLKDIKQIEGAGPLKKSPFWKNIVEKFIVRGTVDGFVEAVRVALGKLKNGCSVKDAKSICEPEIVQLALQLKNKIEPLVKEATETSDTKSSEKSMEKDSLYSPSESREVSLASTVGSEEDGSLTHGMNEEMKLGFVSAPLHPYPYVGSFGWLDE